MRVNKEMRCQSIHFLLLFFCKNMWNEIYIYLNEVKSLRQPRNSNLNEKTIYIGKKRSEVYNHQKLEILIIIIESKSCVASSLSSSVVESPFLVGHSASKTSFHFPALLQPAAKLWAMWCKSKPYMTQQDLFKTISSSFIFIEV